MQGRFLDHRLRPHAVEQFVLGDEMSGAIDECNQQIEGAGAVKWLHRPSAAVVGRAAARSLSCAHV
jgi:hypothetical protein